MFIGKKYKHMADGKHTIDIIDGYGEFICDEASLNLYIVQKQKLLNINREKVLYKSVRELVNDTNVSTATVMRFCKKMGV